MNNLGNIHQVSTASFSFPPQHQSSPPLGATADFQRRVSAAANHTMPPTSAPMVDFALHGMRHIPQATLERQFNDLFDHLSLYGTHTTASGGMQLQHDLEQCKAMGLELTRRTQEQVSVAAGIALTAPPSAQHSADEFRARSSDDLKARFHQLHAAIAQRLPAHLTMESLQSHRFSAPTSEPGVSVKAWPNDISQPPVHLNGLTAKSLDEYRTIGAVLLERSRTAQTTTDGNTQVVAPSANRPYTSTSAALAQRQTATATHTAPPPPQTAANQTSHASGVGGPSSAAPTGPSLADLFKSVTVHEIGANAYNLILSNLLSNISAGAAPRKNELRQLAQALICPSRSILNCIETLLKNCRLDDRHFSVVMAYPNCEIIQFMVDLPNGRQETVWMNRLSTGAIANPRVVGHLSDSERDEFKSRMYQAGVTAGKNASSMGSLIWPDQNGTLQR